MLDFLKKKRSDFNPTIEQIEEGILKFRKMCRNLDLENQDQLYMILKYGMKIILWDIKNFDDKKNYSMNNWKDMIIFIKYIESKLDPKYLKGRP